MTQLREELSRVQADRDRVDQRLLALETQNINSSVGNAAPPTATRSVATPAAGAPPVETPPLRVVRIGADGAAEATAVEETASSIDDESGPRPMLRVTGVPGRRARGVAREDRIEQTIPSEDPPGAASAVGAKGSVPIRERAARPSALDPDAKRAYDDALALVHGKRCQQALDAFAGFIVRWPDHPNADNAMYWRGECYAALGDLPRAIEQFEAAISRFPLGNKVPDALLKLGMSYAKLGNEPKSREAFGRLEREFPRSDARRHIPHGAVNAP